MYRFVLTVCSFILLSSCQFGTSENDPRLLSFFEADALFISNDENMDLEIDYYDALLEVKRLYPTELEEIIVINHNEIKNIQRKLPINSFPSLLLINEKQIITKIEGKQEKNNIIEILSSSIEKLNKRHKLSD
jgi:hypothetical protein